MTKFKRFFCVLISAMMLFCCSAVASAASVEPRAAYVGTLSIFAANDGGSSAWNTSGHAFIAFKNTSSSAVRVGGLNVNPGHEITFGSWGNKDAHKGIWYDLESYLANNEGDFGGRVSLSMSVTQSNINTINSLISKNDTWSLFNNCSSFAVKIWNSVASTTLSAGTPNTPTSLMASIKSKSGYQTNRAIGNTTPIGYVDSNGNFVSVTMPVAAQANVIEMDDATVSTSNEPAVFIVPIDLNPNSCEVAL